MKQKEQRRREHEADAASLLMISLTHTRLFDKESLSCYSTLDLNGFSCDSLLRLEHFCENLLRLDNVSFSLLAQDCFGISYWMILIIMAFVGLGRRLWCDFPANKSYLLDFFALRNFIGAAIPSASWRFFLMMRIVCTLCNFLCYSFHLVTLLSRPT